MNKTKSALMVTLFACMGQGKNHYTKVSIEKVRLLLVKYHGIQVKRRWIFYCFQYLMEGKFITKKKRYKNDDAGLILQIPSLHTMTIKGMRYLVSKRVTGAWKLLKSMVKYIVKKDGRWPGKEDIGAPKDIEQYKPGKEEWDKLLGIVGTKI